MSLSLWRPMLLLSPGGVLLGDAGTVVQEFGDVWLEPVLSQPIHVK